MELSCLVGAQHISMRRVTKYTHDSSNYEVWCTHTNHNRGVHRTWEVRCSTGEEDNGGGGWGTFSAIPPSSNRLELAAYASCGSSSSSSLILFDSSHPTQ